MPLHPWRSQAYLFRSVSRQCGPQRMDYAWRREANLWHESPEGQHLLVLVVTVIDTSQTIHWLVDSVCAGSHACSHARSRRAEGATLSAHWHSDWPGALQTLYSVSQCQARTPAVDPNQKQSDYECYGMCSSMSGSNRHTAKKQSAVQKGCIRLVRL